MQLNDFKVSKDLGNHHRITITTINLRKGLFLELRVKINYRKFKEKSQKSHRSSDLWPAQYPKLEVLNEFSSTFFELIHNSSEEPCVNKKKEFIYNFETQKLIKRKRRRRRNLKIVRHDHYAFYERQ